MQKICKICSEPKEIEEFSPSHLSKDGHEYRCKPCKVKATLESRARKTKGVSAKEVRDVGIASKMLEVLPETHNVGKAYEIAVGRGLTAPTDCAKKWLESVAPATIDKLRDMLLKPDIANKFLDYMLFAEEAAKQTGNPAHWRDAFELWGKLGGLNKPTIEVKGQGMSNTQAIEDKLARTHLFLESKKEDSNE